MVAFCVEEESCAVERETRENSPTMNASALIYDDLMYVTRRGGGGGRLVP